MNLAVPPFSLGTIIAIVVLVLAVVLYLTGDIGQWLAILAGLLAIARLT